MIKCPNCGSSAQLKVVHTEYEENGRDVKVTHFYVCGCGETAIGSNWYYSTSEEVVAHCPRANLQQKLYGRG